MGLSPTTAEAPFRPGTKFFAPQARLVKEDGTPLLIANQPVNADIVSITVTLSATGEVGQVQIVLNNQRHDAHHRPVAPIWRYNRLDTVRFGTRIRVDMRYADEGWTPMILARVTNIDFWFPPGAGSQVTLNGEDFLSLLKVKPDTDYIHMQAQEVDVVDTELREANAGMSLAAPRPAEPFTTPLASITHEKSKTRLEFINELAQRMDFEVFVDFANRSPVRTDEPRPVSLHFEPCRSAGTAAPLSLLWGRDITEFKPAFKVWDVLTAATATGSVPRGRGGFSVPPIRMDDPGVINDLRIGADGARPQSAAAVRASAFSAEGRTPETNVGTVTATNIDEERARMAAKTMLRKSARQFLTAEITTLGAPPLKPGAHVDLTGLYAPFNGVYYVTKTVHTLSAAGYSTKADLQRPGMLDPSGYPGV